MDIRAEKLQLIEWLARLNNAAVLKQFIAFEKRTRERLVGQDQR
jgi:hypothetical protein